MPDLADIRPGHRVLGHKDRTAILKGLDRGLKGPDLLRDIHDLLLVKADHRPEHRHGAYLIRSGQGLDRLGSHLPDALPGDQPQTFLLPGDPLPDPHHIAAHDDRQLLVGALVVDIQLDIGKVHDMEPDRPSIPGHQAGQLHHLFLSPLAGIGRRMEVDRFDHHPALGDHIPCHRAVDPAG